MTEHWSGLPSFTYFGNVVPNHLKYCGAFHEASHAVIGRHHGLEIGEISITLHWDTEDISGLTSIERDEDGARGISDDKLPGWLIGCAAGQVGEAMWWHKYKRVTFEQGMINADAGATTDRALYRKFGGRTPPIALPQARIVAQGLLVRYWGDIERHAATLVRDGSLQGRKIK